MSPADPEPSTPGATAPGLLPATLLGLAVARLPLEAPLVGALAGHGILTVGDALALPAQAWSEGSRSTFAGPLRDALAQVLTDGLRQFAGADSADWATLRAELLGPLDASQRTLLAGVVGLDGAVQTRPQLARQFGVTLPALDDRIEALRVRLDERAGRLLRHLHDELARELAAGDDVLRPTLRSPGSLLQRLHDARQDPALGLRLFAFLFPRLVHLHHGVLLGASPRRCRRLLRQLPRLLAPHRLPLPLDTLTPELTNDGCDVPRGVLLHLLRTELHVAIELDERLGEVAAGDPRSPAGRLADLLAEAGAPMTLPDLVFAWRERFRRASGKVLANHLRHHAEFVRLGPETWALRRWCEAELGTLAPLVDKVARRICADGGRHNIAALLAADGIDERTAWLVQDRLAHDPRVRLLGRGDACAASHRRSAALETLLHNFRRAAGDVVLSRFLGNQPAERRRLVERLLRHNRLFVMPSADRVDTLSNYPFNDERLGRLVALVQEQLAARTGYAHVDALKTVVDRTDLGGSWLTPELLADVLLRHGPFDVLPGGIVARADLDLGAGVRRSLRQALRAAGKLVTVDDVVRAHPELSEFAPSLAGLLGSDPLVQSPDGAHFMLV